MARKEHGMATAQKGLIASAVSCIPFVLESLKEGINMGAPVFSIVRLFASYLDPIMATWIAVVMIAGYWLKRMSLPKWFPPLPVILLIMYLAVSLFFGWLQYDVTGWKGVERVLLYGIGNGIVYTGFSFIVYDIGHGAIKRHKEKKAEKEAA